MSISELQVICFKLDHQNSKFQYSLLAPPSPTTGHTSATSWIGLKKSGSGYTWSDGSSSNFYNWASGAAQTGDCVNMDANGLWRDVACNQVYSYVCKRDDSELTNCVTMVTLVRSQTNQVSGNLFMPSDMLTIFLKFTLNCLLNQPLALGNHD